MNPAHTQPSYRLRFDWGLAGAQPIGSDADVIVVVDVLSFTITLSVALDAGSKYCRISAVAAWITRICRVRFAPAPAAGS